MVKKTGIEALAEALVLSDANFKQALIEKRISKNISIEVVAERTGFTVEHVKEFERYDYDPKLSEVRRYANAIEVVYRHTVKPHQVDD